MGSKPFQRVYDFINLIYELFRGIGVRLMQSDLFLAVGNFYEYTRTFALGVFHIAVIANYAAG